MNHTLYEFLFNCIQEKKDYYRIGQLYNYGVRLMEQFICEHVIQVNFIYEENKKEYRISKEI